MSLLKAVFRFENLDSTRDLNSTKEFLFNKGVYVGGSIVPGINSVTINSFRAMSYDGMQIELPEGKSYVVSVSSSFIGYVCVYAKYVYDSDPILEFKVISEEAYNNIGELSKYYIILAGVSNMQGVVTVDMRLRDEISPVGRNHYKGYFNEEDVIDESNLRPGDWWFVGNNVTNMVDMCMVDNNGNIQVYTNSSNVENNLSMHRSNLDTDVNRGIPAEPQDKTNGALHVNYNELKALGGSAGTPSGSNKFVTEADGRLLTEDEKDALEGNEAGGVPNINNKFVTSNTPIATRVLSQEIDVEAGVITLNSTIVGQQNHIYVGTGVTGTAHQYMEAASDTGSVLFDNDGKVVVIEGVYTNSVCTDELSPEINQNVSNGYWVSAEPLYIKLRLIDSEGTPNLNIARLTVHLQGKLGFITGEATANRIYRYGYREYEVIDFNEAISDKLKIKENSLIIDIPTFGGLGTAYNVLLNKEGLIGSSVYMGGNSWDYIISGNEIGSSRTVAGANSTFNYTNGSLVVSSSIPGNGSSTVFQVDTKSQRKVSFVVTTGGGSSVDYTTEINSTGNLKFLASNAVGSYTTINVEGVTVSNAANQLIVRPHRITTANGYSTATLDTDYFRVETTSDSGPRFVSFLNKNEMVLSSFNPDIASHEHSIVVSLDSDVSSMGGGGSIAIVRNKNGFESSIVLSNSNSNGSNPLFAFPGMILKYKSGSGEQVSIFNPSALSVNSGNPNYHAGVTLAALPSGSVGGMVSIGQANIQGISYSRTGEAILQTTTDSAADPHKCSASLSLSRVPTGSLLSDANRVKDSVVLQVGNSTQDYNILTVTSYDTSRSFIISNVGNASGVASGYSIEAAGSLSIRSNNRMSIGSVNQSSVPTVISITIKATTAIDIRTQLLGINADTLVIEPSDPLASDSTSVFLTRHGMGLYPHHFGTTNSGLIIKSDWAPGTDNYFSNLIAVTNSNDKYSHALMLTSSFDGIDGKIVRSFTNDNLLGNNSTITQCSISMPLSSRGILQGVTECTEEGSTFTLPNFPFVEKGNQHFYIMNNANITIKTANGTTRVLKPVFCLM